ncbi:MAG: DNA-3-methyladenine glycosylase 2 family protein [Acidobacteria bacterium]|nr:MAG: DNA-3-methyladenine glycosylase 2 family protein [Acidobacteriota bacterium]
MPNSQTTLNEELFSQSVRLLTGRDEHLAEVVKAYGQPPLWVREPGFPTLVYIILEQQVSLASARAAFERLKAAVRPLTPKGFLRLNDAELLRIGFSRQKTLYTRLLAESLARRHFNLRYLHGLPDDSAHKMLMAFKGIGRWTADIYLLSALRRPDIWPTGDLALATAVQEVKRLRKRPSPEKLEALGAPWRPWRAVAARLFWHAYLCKRGLKSSAPVEI